MPHAILILGVQVSSGVAGSVKATKRKGTADELKALRLSCVSDNALLGYCTFTALTSAPSAAPRGCPVSVHYTTVHHMAPRWCAAGSTRGCESALGCFAVRSSARRRWNSPHAESAESPRLCASITGDGCSGAAACATACNCSSTTTTSAPESAPALRFALRFAHIETHETFGAGFGTWLRRLSSAPPSHHGPRGGCGPALAGE